MCKSGKQSVREPKWPVRIHHKQQRFPRGLHAHRDHISQFCTCHMAMLYRSVTCTRCRAVHRRITPSLSLSAFPQLSAAHIWQRVTTVQVPPHLLGGCTETTGMLSRCSRSLRSHERLALQPARPPSGVRGLPSK